MKKYEKVYFVCPRENCNGYGDKKTNMIKKDLEKFKYSCNALKGKECALVEILNNQAKILKILEKKK